MAVPREIFHKNKPILQGKKTNKLKATSLMIILLAISSLGVLSVNHYFVVSQDTSLAAKVLFGRRRISMMKTASEHVHGIETFDPCHSQGCANFSGSGRINQEMFEKFKQVSSKSQKLQEGSAKAVSSLCNSIGQGCSSIDLDGPNSSNSNSSLKHLGRQLNNPTAGQPISGFTDAKLSVGEACYQYTEARSCELVPCPGKNAPQKYYRGFVREIQRQGPADPNRTFGRCIMCNLYPRQCLVSVAHRFIYIHVMKTGGNTFQSFLQGALCGDNSTNRRNACPWALRHQLQFMTCEMAFARPGHRDFFKWSFVRDPVARAVSYWAMASRNLNGPPVPFNDWAIAVNSTRKWTKTCKTHRYPQTWSLFGQRDNCPIVDFLGNTGPDTASDFEVVLHRLNVTELWDYYRKVGLSQANKSDRNKTAATLRAISRRASAGIVERYRQDYVNFGYPLPEGTTL